MDEDKMKLSRTRLPAEVRSTLNRLTEGFDPKARASIDERAQGTFIKLERADGTDQKK